MYIEKWQALGNDYVIVDRATLPFELTAARVRALCAPHTGVHCDGVLLISPATVPECVAQLRIFNPDGSEAALSGNGSREAALY
ncbi:MAG: diaminopimelate epimerase, partial [Solirubrobacteraceae bacterium]